MLQDPLLRLCALTTSSALLGDPVVHLRQQGKPCAARNDENGGQDKQHGKSPSFDLVLK